MRPNIYNWLGSLLTALAFFYAAPTLAEPVNQTDWSKVGNIPGPVLQWGNAIAEQTGMAWRSIDGQLALAGRQRSTALRVVVAENADLPRGAAAADFDNDGRTDIVIGDPVTDPFNPVGAIYWWHARPDGSFKGRYVSETFHGTNYLTTADVDLDGDIDIVVAAYYGPIEPEPPPPPHRNGRYAWFENTNGDGSVWDEHVVGELFWGAEYVDVGDFDGDGDLDLVGASYLTRGVYEQESDITWFENLDGAGDSWEMHEVSSQFNNGYEAHFTDLDGDGDLDILGTHADLISWWENTTGRGDVLTFHLITDALQNVGYVNVGDIDNDGDLDVVGSTYSTGTLLWWENLNGSATAWLAHSIGSHHSGEQVELVDIEGDGDLDVIADRRNGSGAMLSVFTNLSGNGSAWGQRTIQYEPDTDYSIAIADADNDGKIDVVVASEDFRRALGKQVSFFDLSTFESPGALVSSILDAGPLPAWGALTWDATIPDGAGSTVEIRGSDDSNDLGPFVAVPTSGTNIANLIDGDARYLQYRLSFTGNAEASPIFRALAIERAGEGIGLVLTGPALGRAGVENELIAQSDVIGSKIFFGAALRTGQTSVPNCPGVTVGLDTPIRVLGSAVVDADGLARVMAFIPAFVKGRTLYFQALNYSDCVNSNVLAIPFD